MTLRIREIMKEKKIGNKALAEASGLPIGTLNKIIYGETTNPSLDSIKAIAKALGCTLDDLVEDRRAGEFFNDPEVAEIVQEMHDRPELKTLFSTTKKVTKEDIEFVQAFIDKIANKDDE